MPFIGKQPAPAVLTSSDITDGIITTAKIADDAVDNTKLDLTDDFAFTGTISGAGGLIKLHTETISANTASISIDGYFSSSYTNYLIIASSLVPDNSGPHLDMRYRVSNADLTGGDYIWSQNTIRIQDSTGAMEEDNNAYKDNYIKLSSTLSTSNNHDGNSSKRAWNFNMYLHDPLGTTNMKYFYGSSHNVYDNNNDVWYYNHHIAGTFFSNSSALSGFTIYPSAGNIDSGTISLYGVTK